SVRFRFRFPIIRVYREHKLVQESGPQLAFYGQREAQDSTTDINDLRRPGCDPEVPESNRIRTEFGRSQSGLWSLDSTGTPGRNNAGYFKLAGMTGFCRNEMSEKETRPPKNPLCPKNPVYRGYDRLNKVNLDV